MLLNLRTKIRGEMYSLLVSLNTERYFLPAYYCTVLLSFGINTRAEHASIFLLCAMSPCRHRATRQSLRVAPIAFSPACQTIWPRVNFVRRSKMLLQMPNSNEKIELSGWISLFVG